MRTLVYAVAVATLTAAAGALLVWILARVTGEDLVVEIGPGEQQVAWLAAVVLTVIGGLVALVLGVVAGRTAQPRRTVLVVGVVGTLLSFVQPVLAARQVSTALWLCVMHVVVAAVLVPAVARRVPDRRAAVATG